MDAAIAGFAGEPQLWCDDQFAVLPNSVLGFITLGESTDESHLTSPSTVIWKPRRINYAPSDEYTWLPSDVREVFDRSGRKVVRLRRHYIFLRAASVHQFVYAGEAHLGSYGGPRDDRAGNREARFTLNDRLPRHVWLECGGYSGWHFEVNHEDHIIGQDEFSKLEEILGRLGDQDYSHLRMTRYEEDSLTIHTNPERAWLMYLREPADCGLYLNDSTLDDEEEHFECVCGISLEFPASQTVSHSQAAQIARHFFKTGDLPDYVAWQEM
jgi:hypothetical protein